MIEAGRLVSELWFDVREGEDTQPKNEVVTILIGVKLSFLFKIWQVKKVVSITNLYYI